MKFDDIIEHIGQFGRYQKWIYGFLCIPSITIGLQTMMTVFTMAVPDHRCALPGLLNDTYNIQSEAHADAINSTIPPGDDGTSFSHCLIYGDVAAHRNPFNVSVQLNASFTPLEDQETVACNRWVYDRSTFSSTLITKLDLVCEHKLAKSHAQMFQMLGSLFGALLLGPPADFFGRKVVMMVCILFQVGASVALAFTPSFVFLCAFLFCNGMSCTALYCVLFVLGMELVGPKKRVYAGFVIVTFFGVGVMLLSGLAFFIRHWQQLQLVTSCISVLYISYYWLVPESPRWLISKRRYSEAEIILQKAAKTNGKEIPSDLLQFDNLKMQEKVQVREPLWRIITYPRLVIRTLIIYVNWMVCSMTYYGLGLNVGDLVGSIYLNSLLYGLVETVSYIVCMALLDKLGRRKLYLASIFLAGISCTASPFPYVFGGSEWQWLTVVFAILGKFGVSAAFAIMWLYSGELFPTVVRNSGVSSSSVCARIGGVISPYIANMTVTIGGQLGQLLPLIIFGSLSLIAGLMSLVLPETKGARLPETFKDANDFGRKIPVYANQIQELEGLKSSDDRRNSDVKT